MACCIVQCLSLLATLLRITKREVYLRRRVYVFLYRVFVKKLWDNLEMVMEAPPNPQMVKEAPPNPQCVGREFVRQYYTLLNACPAHLHRFYNNHSSFVHGGLDAPNRETKPVVGQKQIHQKIQQLNFRDCHAKISQVDSQATLGNGVVVQVTGELSNCGQPMRRFTQTFVLAAQSPKQYYVHNDIFRYQDIMFSDEEVEQDSGHSAAEEDVEPEHAPKPEAIVPNQQMQPPQTMAYYSATTAAAAAAAAGNAAPVNPQPPPPQIAASLPHPMAAGGVAAAAAPPPPQAVVSAPVAAVVNGSAHPEEVISASAPAQPVPQPPIPTLAPMPQPPVPIQPAPAPLTPAPPAHPTPEEEPEPEQGAEDEGEGWGEPEVTAEDEKEKQTPENAEEPSHHTPETASSEPKTYANLVKSGVSTSSSFSSAISTSPNVPAKPPSSPPPSVQRPLDSRENVPVSTMPSGGSGGLGLGSRGARRGGGNVRGMARPDRGTPGRGNFNEDSSTAGGDGHNRRMGNVTQQYADTQQLFMGNLPHQATEDDLRELFSKYGPIIDLRILSKHNSKNMPGNRVPNYGFIVFESATTVQAVLNSRPIYYPDETGQKLNVEEKKAKVRSMDGTRMGSGGDTMLGGGRPNSGMGGGRGAPGMMRGGPGMHRGGGRGGFSRGDGRGGGMNRAGYTRR